MMAAVPLLLAVLLVACESSPPTYQAAIAEAQTAAGEAMAASGATAMTLALIDGEHMIWSETRRASSLTDPVGPDTMFAIGSVSKVFAAMAVMILVERKLVSLDGKLVDYLPDFSMLSPEHKDITVRMLIDHSAGLPGGDLRGMFSEAPSTGAAAEMMEALKHQRLKHRPGYLHVYSNDGFTMVENLVKAKTGLPFPEFVRQEILTPLHMSHSRYGDTRLPEGAYVRAYDSSGLKQDLSLNLYATGGLWSTAQDMAQLCMTFINGGALGSTRILSAASVAEMARGQTRGSFDPEPSDYVRYGLGWDTVTQPGLKAVGIRVVQKGGAIDQNGPAYRAELAIAPDERLAAVVMMASNKIDSDMSILVAERMLLRALVERGTLEKMPDPLAPATLAVAPPGAEEQSSYTGYYAAASTLYRLSFTDGALSLETFDGESWQPKYTGLRKRSDGCYSVDGSLEALHLFEADGRRYISRRWATGMLHYTTRLVMAQKVEAREPLSDLWQARTKGVWLPVNEASLSYYAGKLADQRASPVAAAFLPGYLFFAGSLLRETSDDRLDGMFLQIPQAFGRDLRDLSVEKVEGAEWLRFGSYLYRPLAGLPTVIVGTSTVVIGSQGHIEWRELPTIGSLTISGASSWRVFDGSFLETAHGTKDGTATLPATGTAAYLMLAGAPGSTITLTLEQ